MKTIVMLGACLGLAASASAAPRDVQFRSVNLATGVIELHNFGDTAEDLSGWRFCSHNASVVRRYSASGGLNGIVIQPGDSLFVHLSGGASAADEINASTIGGNFAAFSASAYGIQIYFPPSLFGNGDLIADTIQWTADGTPDATADERSDEAVAGGVWGAINDFIAVNGGGFIRLLNLTGAELNTSADYRVEAAPIDNDGDGRDDAFAVLDGDAELGATGGGCVADLDGDGVVGSGDLGALLAAWGPCP